MAAFVIVQADSYSDLQEKSFNIFQSFNLRVFHCRHKMKYNCHQVSSVIRSYFVYLVFGLRKASPRDSTKVKVKHAHLLAFWSCLQGEPE